VRQAGSAAEETRVRGLGNPVKPAVTRKKPGQTARAAGGGAAFM